MIIVEQIDPLLSRAVSRDDVAKIDSLTFASALSVSYTGSATFTANERYSLILKNISNPES